MWFRLLVQVVGSGALMFLIGCAVFEVFCLTSTLLQRLFWGSLAVWPPWAVLFAKRRAKRRERCACASLFLLMLVQVPRMCADLLVRFEFS